MSNQSNSLKAIIIKQSFNHLNANVQMDIINDLYLKLPIHEKYRFASSIIQDDNESFFSLISKIKTARSNGQCLICKSNQELKFVVDYRYSKEQMCIDCLQHIYTFGCNCKLKRGPCSYFHYLTLDVCHIHKNEFKNIQQHE